VTNPDFASLDGESYLSLETFRRDGRGVRTPVWFARRGAHLYVFTERDAGKVKRLRNEGRARIAACNVRGRIHGDARAARVRIVDDTETESLAYAALHAKYGWQMRAVDFFSALSGRIHGRAVLEIAPDETAEA
jgi:PPOX class probable F420-dependent enzyme